MTPSEHMAEQYEACGAELMDALLTQMPDADWTDPDAMARARAIARSLPVPINLSRDEVFEGVTMALAARQETRNKEAERWQVIASLPGSDRAWPIDGVQAAAVASSIGKLAPLICFTTTNGVLVRLNTTLFGSISLREIQERENPAVDNA